MNIHKYIYIILCSIIVAQEPVTSKEWKEISCVGIENINCEQMSEIKDNSNYYIYQVIKEGQESYLYKFVPNKQNATLIKTYNLFGVPLKTKIFAHENFAYVCSKDSMWGGIATGIYEALLEDPLPTNKVYYFYEGDFGVGPLFTMNQEFYFITNNGKLFKIKLTYEGDSDVRALESDYGQVIIEEEYPFKDTLNEDTSIVTLKNTIYYFSNNGFCSTKISNNTAVSEIVSSVSVTDATSSLVTDNNYRVWIINKTDGVVEYDTKNNTATTIATFPASRLSNRTPDFTKACCYADNYLYLITNGRVYSLDVSTTPDDPDDPQKSHDQSGHRFLCGCLGIEFICLFLGLFLLHRKH